MIEEHEYEYELIAPLVVCSDLGGPYDSQAFVAGVRYAQLRFRLQTGRPTTLEEYEHPELRPQLELLAMELGYELTTTPFDEDWELVKFSLAGTSGAEIENGGGE